jgi:pyruvate dehydrogenase E2 component (dihydrolipoamide acetyltransferase)
MAEVIRMPKMSDTMTEGVIVAWHKKEGDKVKPGDLLAEIETDKAVMEYESFQEGTLLHIGVQQGQTVKVDDVIAVIGKEGEDYKSLLAGESNTEAKTVTEKQPEEKPAAEKEKPQQEKAATTESKADNKEEIEKISEEEPADTGHEDATHIKASPLAKKIASESGVPITKIKGSGDEGRIVRRDVEKYLSETPKQPASAPVYTGEESFEEVPVSMMRKTIARRLAESKFTAPHFYLTMEINMDRCVEARAALNETHPDKKISFNDIIIKATALALRQHPKVNASWIAEAGSTGQIKIRHNHHIHIGMAVAVEDGLLVPVIKFADQKSLSQINEEAKMLAARAKEKKLQPEEMQGNTFTISNLGMMDIDEFYGNHQSTRRLYSRCRKN